MNEQVQVAAGGHSTRLRSHMDDLGYDSNYPKHLLPTGLPGGETFLGRIVRQALILSGSDDVTVHLNQENIKSVIGHPDIPRPIEVNTQTYNHSLDMFFERLCTTRQRVIGCAGDFYAEDGLQELVDHHNRSKFPVTVLAGYSVAVDGGVSYTINDNNKITSIERVCRTRPDGPINIGAYVLEPDVRVLSVLRSYRPSSKLAPKDDRIFEAFIRHGLVGAYVTERPTFNVNTPETYRAMLDYTGSLKHRSASA